MPRNLLWIPTILSGAILLGALKGTQVGRAHSTLRPRTALEQQIIETNTVLMLLQQNRDTEALERLKTQRTLPLQIVRDSSISPDVTPATQVIQLGISLVRKAALARQAAPHEASIYLDQCQILSQRVRRSGQSDELTCKTAQVLAQLAQRD